MAQCLSMKPTGGKKSGPHWNIPGHAYGMHQHGHGRPHRMHRQSYRTWRMCYSSQSAVGTGWGMTPSSGSKWLQQTIPLIIHALSYWPKLWSRSRNLIFVAAKMTQTKVMCPRDTASTTTAPSNDAQVTHAHTAMHATNVTRGTNVSSTESRVTRAASNISQTRHLPNKQPSQLPNQPECSLPTPVKLHRLNILLDGFPQKEYIINGFTHGFKIHFQGPEVSVHTGNSRITQQTPEQVDKKIAEELAAGKIRGPFDKPPLPSFKMSPLSLREKSTPGTYRLLHNLSAHYDERAVNYNILHEFTLVQYARLRDAISLIQEVGRGAYLAKADIKHAFRIIPLHPDIYYLFGFLWRHSYYYDTCLAMGLSEACQIFETKSDGITYILRTHFGIERVIKILNDFLFVDPTLDMSRFSLRTFTTVVPECGIPIAWEKTSQDSTTSLIFYEQACLVHSANNGNTSQEFSNGQGAAVINWKASVCYMCCGRGKPRPQEVAWSLDAIT